MPRAKQGYISLDVRLSQVLIIYGVAVFGAGQSESVAKEIHARPASLPTFKHNEACLSIEDIPLQGVNLTDKELKVLSDSICWRDGLDQSFKAYISRYQRHSRRHQLQCNTVVS